MKKLLLLSVLSVGLLLSACEKDNPTVVTIPTSDMGTWILHINGNPTDSFRLHFTSSVPPYFETDYQSVIGQGNNPLVIKMQVNAAYTCSYMGTDSIIRGVYHMATSNESRFEDTIHPINY